MRSLGPARLLQWPCRSLWSARCREREALGGAGADNGYGITTLSDGSALVTGSFNASVTFGSTNLSASGGGNDVFVAKVNADGTWAWAVGAGGTSWDEGRSITALADGSDLVTGRFRGTATFGSTSLISAGGLEAFVAKIGATGTWGG